METTSIEMFTSTIKYSGDYIFIQPVCDFFQINSQNQYRMLAKDQILKNERIKKSSMFQFSDERPRIALSKRGFIRWIQLLNPQIVQVSLIEKLIQYQTLIFDYLFGNVERHQEMKTVAQRRDRLKRLKTRVNFEINKCQEKLDTYITGDLAQTQIEFNQSKNLQS